MIETTSEITVDLHSLMGSDASVVQAARVSTVGEECLESEPGQHAGLINYLMKHRHGTPFEHNSITFFVKAPIFVWREWHRHRIGFSYNEESARYKVLDPLFYLPEETRPMFKVEGWKPGRPKFTQIDSVDERAKFFELRSNLKEVYKFAYATYMRNLELGIDPGLARDCLPVGIYSSCWVTCNARSLMAFLSLRTHEPIADRVSYPLYEIEVAARKCEEHFARLFPLTHSAWNTNGRIAP
jgi:thymidylate synthase (FAD)